MADAVSLDWEEKGPAAFRRPPASSTPLLSVEGFEGPLDFLLEMVRRQRVDLGRLSIVALIDQFVVALEGGAGQVSLERRADWLVMASQLLLLKAQLLAPSNPQAAEDAAAEAGRRLGQLEALAAAQAAAAWLAHRPQLRRDVFARGRQEPSAATPQAALYVAFLEATLVMLEGREGWRAEAPADTRPTRPELWRVADALQRLPRMLSEQPDGLTLEQCLPEIPAETANRSLKTRAALASTLVAGLELARDGTAAMEQESLFGTIRLKATAAQAALGSAG